MKDSLQSVIHRSGCWRRTLEQGALSGARASRLSQKDSRSLFLQSSPYWEPVVSRPRMPSVVRVWKLELA